MQANGTEKEDGPANQRINQYIWLRDNSQLNIYRHSLFSMKMDTYKYSTNYQHHEHAESKLPY